MTAQEKLTTAQESGKYICVGLDTDLSRIPTYLLNKVDPVFSFNKIIIENTSDLAAAYKINFAFYEKDGIKGFESLKRTIDLIGKDIFIIADAKRGDIGNTSLMYAQSLFEYFKVDASTLHPYMGKDSLQPFLDYKDKIHFILALTSNPGASDFEKLQLNDGKLLYQKVIEKVIEWNEYKNCGIVFGATQFEELKENIELIKSLPLLLPGVGAQGGNLEQIVSFFTASEKFNYLINVSRALLYLSNNEDFGLKTRAELEKMNKIVQKHL